MSHVAVTETERIPKVRYMYTSNTENERSRIGFLKTCETIITLGNTIFADLDMALVFD